MSGRDPSLVGFNTDSVRECLKQTQEASAHFTIPRLLLNYLIGLVEGFKLEPTEFCNALAVYNHIALGLRNSSRLNPASLFYAAVRVSVFWRRRRDILTHHHDIVQKVLASFDLTTQSIVDAECEVLSALACNVWPRCHNPSEIIDLLIPRCKMFVVTDLAHDLCMIACASENYFWSKHTCLEIGASCVVAASLLATKSGDPGNISRRIIQWPDLHTIDELSNLMLLTILSN